MSAQSRAQSSPSFLLPRFTAPASFLTMHTKTWRAFYMVCIFLSVSARVNAAVLPPACVTTYDADVDYFPDKVAPDEADHFEVTYHDNYKVLKNTAVGTEETYVLTLCGTPTPATADFPDAKFFEIPLKKVAIGYTTTATFMELLGLRSKIHRMNDLRVTSPCLKEVIAGKPLDGGGTWGNQTARDTQLADMDAVMGGYESGEPKSIAMTESGDPSPLNRAEWVEFVAVLFNKEKEANELYANTKARYNCQTEHVSGQDKPIVAWVNFYLTYQIVTTQYKVDYITEAGGTPFVPDVTSYNTSSEFVDALVGGNVDIVIDSTYFYSPATKETNFATLGFNLTNAADAAFVKNLQVWRHDKSVTGVADDWFESALPEPDVVQQDLLKIFHPEFVMDKHVTRWFRNIAKEEPQVPSSTTCADVNAVLTPRLDSLVPGCPDDDETSGASAMMTGASYLMLGAAALYQAI